MSQDREGPKLEEIAPGMIVAMPNLSDENFNRTVVLLLRSTEEGAFGLVINRGSGIPLASFCQEQQIDYRGPKGLEINLGGPVEVASHLLVLHGDEPVLSDKDEDELELMPGIRVVTAMTGLKALAGRGSERFRCYLGYAGWGPGQLEWELSQGAWVPLPSESEFVFSSPGPAIWERALRSAGIDPISLVPGGAIN